MAIVKEKPKTQDEALQKMQKVIGYLASRFARNHRDRYEELFNEGVIGLCTAYNKYDPKAGSAFSSYAYYWIYACIKSAAMKGWETMNNTSSKEVEDLNLSYEEKKDDKLTFT